MKKKYLFPLLFCLFFPTKNIFCAEIKEIFPFNFEFQQVEKGETLWSIFRENWEIVAKINRISPHDIKEGKVLIVPTDMDKSRMYSPLPFQRYEQESFLILISIREQALGIYKKGHLYEWMPISSGKKGHETPSGKYRISDKKRRHFSSKYPEPKGGAPMPYALRFQGPYWIHAGVLPGYPDSFGCVRLTITDAERLFAKTPTGTLVLIE